MRMTFPTQVSFGSDDLWSMFTCSKQYTFGFDPGLAGFPINYLLRDDLVLEGMLRKVYGRKVVFNDFLDGFCLELMRLFGETNPTLRGAIRAEILSYPYRERFFEKLTKVAQAEPKQKKGFLGRGDALGE